MSGSEHAAWAPGYGNPALLRQGRRARIVRATRSTSGADVVLKVLPEHLGRAELNQLRELSGVPGVVPLLDAGTTAEGDLFVVLPFYADGSFGDMLARRGPAPVQEAAAVSRSVAAALGSMHGRGLLHGDVCPGNILRAGRTPVLTGFGSVHRSGEALPPPDPATESFLHAAPEALRGEPRTPASDVYQLASTVWTMLVGYTPFSSTDGTPFDPRGYAERVLTQDPKPVPRADISRKLRGVLTRALAKLPEERFATPAAFASAFEQARTSRAATTLGATGGQEPLSGAQAPMSGPQVPMSGAQTPMEDFQPPTTDTRTPHTGPQHPTAPPQVPVSGPQAPMSGPQTPMSGPQIPMSGAQTPMEDFQPPTTDTRTPHTGPQLPPPPYAAGPQQDAYTPWTGPRTPPPAPPGPQTPPGTDTPPSPALPSSGPQNPPATAWFRPSGPQTSHAPAAPHVPPHAPPPFPGEAARHPATGPQQPRPQPSRELRPRPTGLEGSRLPAVDAGGTAEIMMAKLRGEEISALRAWSRLEGWTGTAESSALPVDESTRTEDDTPSWGPVPETEQHQPRWRRHLHIAVTVCGILVVTSVSGVFAALESPAPVVAAAEQEAEPEPAADEEAAEPVVDPSAPPEVSAPTGVVLADSLNAVELSWTDNSGGTASFFVLGGPFGHEAATLARTGPGVVTAQVATGYTGMEYCFTVIAVDGSASAAEEVCTTRAADRAEAEAERLAEEEAAEEAAREAEEEAAEEEPSPSPDPEEPAE
ncbi:serine/threonine protein kinase [Nocardiopsis dassonvillei]|uniref:non-specific serine/threonine protein kinase n=1 Tax=Nocardiopsis dassonvillei (strain ATCC 23218 / DSM 43111 / CIP 107115 / JCM 7437 / KCTC 9190 / NBRC 14626 / NCTC 10488 / NRRL B-5397 / IMRU 509) TaxID=446468 RepID=D7B9E6_NOCDD|nr:protein kinase [Nocardiopsis dassonvillei]ADH70804.1 serine/threonine protein kinase [Nocardiopsis dassonvillei subsp. dassonvillei DSM 43111]NKY78046.1 protein kinase [Nocardiopsis dassonvillei]VEI91014.1 Serine/threonine-protein kinase pknK [Nocardiopsis dassonvillei]